MSETVSGAAIEGGANPAAQARAAQRPAAAGVHVAQPAVVPRTARGRRVLIIVENLPCPFDRRVMQEARTLTAAGYSVSIISPKAPGYEKSFESIDGIHIHRHALPREADGALGYALEYSVALLMEFWLSLRILFGRGFDVIHACNPPDTIFLIGGFYKLFGKKFVFDHHDINPELYEAKFGKRGFGQKLLLALERLTFRTADMVISTNESYRWIALTRGGVRSRRRIRGAFRSRSHAPAAGAAESGAAQGPQVPGRLRGRHGQAGGHRPAAAGRAAHRQAPRTHRHPLRAGGRRHRASGHAASSPRTSVVAEYVTFTGRVPDDELLEMLNTADICVNPDRANDMNDRSTMNKVMEYMALGKPVVQFDLTEGRVSAGEASWYARPNDVADLAQKMVALLNDAPQRARMGALGRERIEDVLSWQHEAPRLLAAYDHLLKNNRLLNTSGESR